MSGADDPGASRARPRPRQRHLLDPENLAASHRASQGTAASLTRVQRWVLSVLAVTTILHLSGGLVLAAVFTEGPDASARVGLNVMAAFVGVLAVAVGLLVHGRSPVTGWLSLGLLPGLLGLWLTFG